LWEEDNCEEGSRQDEHPRQRDGDVNYDVLNLAHGDWFLLLFD